MTALSPSKRSLLAPTVPVLCERECESGQPDRIALPAHGG
jgi:hypothetical protein